MLLIGDIGALYTAVWCALLVRHAAFPSGELVAVHVLAFSLLFPLWFFVFFIFGLYDRHTHVFVSELPRRIVYAQGINILIATIFFFVLPLFSITPKIVLVLFLVISTALLLVFRVLMVPTLLRRRPVSLVVLGGSAYVPGLVHTIVYESAHAVSCEGLINPRTCTPETCITMLTQLCDTFAVEALVVGEDAMEIPEIRAYLFSDAWVGRGIVILPLNMVYEEIYQKVALSQVPDTLLRAQTMLVGQGAYDVIKRMIDILLALLLFVPACVVSVIAMLCVYLETGTPLYIAQTRIGLRGKPFTLFKIRSMQSDESGSAVLNSSGTITRVGAVLRRTRIDELPQLVNVLRGDLSFVGPRPELPALVSEYMREIPYYAVRHTVRPGLSGWAQVHHDEHPHHGVAHEQTREKLAYDLFYVAHRSWFLDAVVLLHTFRVLLTKRGS